MTTPSLTLVSPKSGVVNVGRMTNLDNVRALIHQLTPVVVTVLTALSITTEDKAAIWVALFFAVVDPLLSYRNTVDKARQIAYGVLGLAQSGGLLTAALMVAPPTAVPVVSAAITILTSTLSRFYTPTSTVRPETTPAATGSRSTPWPVS